MNEEPRKSALGGGVFLTLLPVAGFFIGGEVFDQPSAGLLVGLGIGAAIAGAFLLRRR